jgi:hypothetical protein
VGGGKRMEGAADRGRSRVDGSGEGDDGDAGDDDDEEEEEGVGKRCNDEPKTGRQGRSCRVSASRESCQRAVIANAGDGNDDDDDDDAYCKRSPPPTASSSLLIPQVTSTKPQHWSKTSLKTNTLNPDQMMVTLKDLSEQLERAPFPVGSVSFAVLNWVWSLISNSDVGFWSVTSNSVNAVL